MTPLGARSPQWRFLSSTRDGGASGGCSCKLNLIPFNPFPASGFATSPRERIRAFAHALQDAGLVATVRKTRGDDIDAACGQLAGQVQDRTRRRLATRIHVAAAR